jgi:hypothetical protein
MAAISSVRILRRKGKENNLTLREALIAQRHPARSSRSVIREAVITQRHPARSSRSVIREAVITKCHRRRRKHQSVLHLPPCLHYPKYKRPLKAK